MSSGTTINKIFIAERDDFHRDGPKSDSFPCRPFAPNFRSVLDRILQSRKVV